MRLMARLSCVSSALLLACLAVCVGGCERRSKPQNSLPPLGDVIPNGTARHLGVGRRQRVSPDGLYLAVTVFYHQRPGKPPALLLIDMHDGASREIDKGWVCDWSPTGHRIAYLGRIGGTLEARIHDLDSQSSQRLPWASDVVRIRWAPAGDSLCLVGMDARGDSLMVAPLSGVPERELVYWSYIALESVSWGPESRQVYFSGRQSGHLPPNIIARADVDTGKINIVAQAPSGSSLRTPELSADGSRLFYYRSTPAGENELWMLNSETLDQSPVPIGVELAVSSQYAVSPDGSRLVLPDVDGRLWCFDLRMRELSLLANDGSAPQWIPGSTNEFIYFQRTAVSHDEAFRVYRQPVPSGERVLVSTF